MRPSGLTPPQPIFFTRPVAMLFNSFTFLFLFLPITAIGYFLLARRSHVQDAGWLALASRGGSKRQSWA